jgi:myo-inositol-1(or 4)-monophosphatase
VASNSAQSEDWLALCRRAADGVAAVMARYPRFEDRAQKTGRGEGGDMALIIDREAEDVIFAELEALGEPLSAVSEERGRIAIHGGGPTQVVVDPIDGSLNAKRGMPLYCMSIAVADGLTMRDVRYAFVKDFGSGEEWWAARGEGALLNGEPVPPLHETGQRVEVLGIESGDPRRIARHATALAATTAHRLRLIGSLALGLCWVGGGRFDALLSLRGVRSVDVAAGQLVVREAGGDVVFPDVEGDLSAPLDLDMRSTVVAARAHGLATELARDVLGA